MKESIMQVKNISARAWNIGGVYIIPGEVATIDDEMKASVASNAELEIVAPKAGRPAKVEQE
jgi:hypothetical protein